MRIAAPAVVVAVLASAAHADPIFIDFGRTDLQTPGNWNNVIPTTTVLPDLDDAAGNPTGVQLEITDEFFQTGEPSQLGSESPSGDAAIFPVSATDDYFFGHSGPFAGADDNPTGAFTLSGLDDNLTYDFTIFTSRQVVGDSRETRYTATGANNLTGLLEPANNDTEVLNLIGVVPAGGVITVSVEAGPNNTNANGFYYLGAVRITEVPAPGTTALLAAGALAVARRRR